MHCSPEELRSDVVEESIVQLKRRQEGVYAGFQ